MTTNHPPQTSPPAHRVLDCGIPGVTALEKRRKGTLPADLKADLAAHDVITERLYICGNGWQLGARRGGRLHLADNDTWEIFVLDARGITNCRDDGTPETVGFVDEATLQRAVRRLARWHDRHCAREVSPR